MIRPVESLRLSDVCRISHGFAFPGGGFSDDPSLPTLVTPGNFRVGGGFRDAKPKTFSGDIPDDYILNPGDLIVTMTDLSVAGDTLGYAALVPKKGTYLHNQRIGRLNIIREDLVSQSYLYWLMRSRSYRQHVLATATGSTVRHTSPDRILEFSWNFPSLNEQNRIASVLSALDDLIEGNLEIMASTLELSRSLFAELLSGGFETLPMRSIADINPDRVPRPKEEQVCYLAIADVGDGRINWPEEMFWPTAPAAARLTARQGDVIWSRVRPNRRSHGLIPKRRLTCVVSTGMVVLRPTRVSSAYLMALTDSESFSVALTSLADGTAYPTVTPEVFRDILVPILPQERMSHFDAVMSPLWEAFSDLEHEVSELSLVRDELLPLLIAGRVRVLGEQVGGQ